MKNKLKKHSLLLSMISLLSLLLFIQSCNTVGSKSGMLSVITNDTTVTASGQREKTYAYSWKKVDPSLTHIIPFLWMPNSTDNATIEKAVQYTNAMPSGHRVIYIDRSMYRYINKDSLDNCVDPTTGKLTKYRSVWWDHGVQVSKSWLNRIIKMYANDGGKADYLVLDSEVFLNNWNMQMHPKAYSLSAIQNDPRFKKLIPLIGFSDLSTINNTGTSKNYMIWNDIMRERTANYIDQGVFNVVKKYFPNIKGSDYKYCNYNQNYQMIEKNGHNMDYYGKGAIVGTDQNWNLYGEFGSVRDMKLDGVHLYNNTPFNSFRLDVNMMRAMKLASNNPVSPWIGARSYGSSNYSPISNTDYYQEMVLHVLLTGPRVLLYFNDPEFSQPGNNKALNQTLKEFDSIAGYKNKKTLVNKEASWGADYVLTGMLTGGRKVWRFTPDLSKDSTASSTIVKNSGGEVVVKTAKTRITFTQGTIYTPTNPVSNKGLWILQPANATSPKIENL